MSEPHLLVGLLPSATAARFTLRESFHLDRGLRSLPAGTALRAESRGQQVALLWEDGREIITSDEVVFTPFEAGRFLLQGMTVGIAFHWEHQEDLEFVGGIRLKALGDGTFALLNSVPLEAYLESVISSEMSADNHPELLKAHAVISRSWLLAQLAQRDAASSPPAATTEGSVTRWIRWYDREDHTHFDVCADDHCQRYQGVGRLHNAAAAEAVHATRGIVLMSGGAVCDARFSKSCGGVTAPFSTAWADEARPYLLSVPDRADQAPVDLCDESAATAWIEGDPEAWCNTHDEALLARILPALDRSTRDFWRWEVRVTAAQVRAWVLQKTGIDLGEVLALEPVERDPSGRLVRLRVVGSAHTLDVSKELEIRKLLSASHLYSSAFTVHPEGDGFLLLGAGWGHGVGLCQIGAAVMAETGHRFEAILSHYYRNTVLEPWY